MMIRTALDAAERGVKKQFIGPGQWIEPLPDRRCRYYDGVHGGIACTVEEALALCQDRWDYAHTASRAQYIERLAARGRPY